MRKIYFALFCTILFISACATQEPMYYWGNYSQSLYKYKKTPNEENLKAHKLTLVKIIQESNKLNKRVPPGICCEYGYLLLKEGKTQEAENYFRLEEDMYPESKVFINRLKIKFIQKKEESP